MTENGEKNAKKARMEDDPFRWPGYTGEAYPEMCDIRAMPPQPKESELKPGQLPEKLIRQYFEEVWSYLVHKQSLQCRESRIEMLPWRYIDSPGILHRFNVHIKKGIM